MTIFNSKLGGSEVTIHAPAAGEFDAEAFIAAFPSNGLYGLDVEGTYMSVLAQWDPEFEIRLIQFATDDYAWVLDLDDPEQHQAAIDLLADQSVWFCSHTPMDVISVFSRLGVDITQRNVDTRVLAKMADPDSQGGLDLKTLATKYGMPQLSVADKKLDAIFMELWLAAGGKRNAKNAKGEDEDDHNDNDVARFGWATISVTDENYLIYAGLDAIACRRLMPQLARDTHAPQKLLDTEIWLAGQANRISIRGMRVDKEALHRHHAEATRVAAESRLRLSELSVAFPMTGCRMWESWPKKRREEEGFTPLSPGLKPHKINLKGEDGKTLYLPNGEHRKTCKNRLECPGCKTYVQEECCQGWLAQHGVDWETWPGEWTDTGGVSLAKRNLDLIGSYPLDEAGRTVFEAMKQFRTVQNKLTTTKQVLARMDPNGRVHTTLKTVEAVTGRMSSTGPNFQNFSKENPEMRGMFIPEEGYTFITADFDQVELRVVAALARETKMIDTILAGGDLHDLTVEEMAAVGVTITRDTAKMTNFLIVYGGGGPALASQARIPLEEASDIVAKFRSRYTAIKRYSQQLGKRTDYVTNISGRRIPVTINKKTGESRSYANINYVVQSSARELLVHAWKRFATEFGRGDMVWFPIHDELVLQVPNHLVKVVMREIETCMRFDFMGVPISASAVPLVEPSGTSRWMTSKLADQYAEQRAVCHVA